MLTLLASLLLGRPIVMVHYMPWYESKPVSGHWGWHWTMNHYNPERRAGRVEAASKFRPLIGLYDSSDPEVLECQIQQMKLAGIDGVFIDWYGNEDYLDYGTNHRNALRMMSAAKRGGLLVSVVYEDNTLNNLISGGKVKRDRAAEYGQSLMRWASTNWFSSSSWLRVNGRPVFLVFGPQYFKERDWSLIFAGLDPKPMFYSEAFRKGPADGAFGWPAPQWGEDGSWTDLQRFYVRAKGWPTSISVAYPRFQDVYADAGVHKSWGSIRDDEGATYTKTFSMALKSGSSILQIATWNDWGEGTQIEPSVEYGYRDLEATQRLAGRSKYSKADLRLPARLLELRRKSRGQAGEEARLGKVSEMLMRGQVGLARQELARMPR